jgi:hypothetical protein
MNWRLRPATPTDLEDLVEIRAVVMRPDLERLGRYDAHRVRQRLRDSYVPEHTRILEVGGELAGSIAVRPTIGGGWSTSTWPRAIRAKASGPQYCAPSWTRPKRPSG